MIKNIKVVLKKLILFILIFLFYSLLLFGCNHKESPVGRLEINFWNYSLGSVNKDPNQTRFSYDITLANKTPRNVFIKSIRPVIKNESLQNRVINKETITEVHKVIESNNYIQISAEILLDTQGLTKEEILQFAPFITGIEVNSEQTIILESSDQRNNQTVN